MLDQLIALYLAIMAYKKLLLAMAPGAEVQLDIPNVVFKLGKVHYEVTELTIARAE